MLTSARPISLQSARPSSQALLSGHSGSPSWGGYNHPVPPRLGHAHPLSRPRPSDCFRRGRGASPPAGFSTPPLPTAPAKANQPRRRAGLQLHSASLQATPTELHKSLPGPRGSLKRGRPAHSGLPGRDPAHLRWGCPAPWPPNPSHLARLRWGLSVPSLVPAASGYVYLPALRGSKRCKVLTFWQRRRALALSGWRLWRLPTLEGRSSRKS